MKSTIAATAAAALAAAASADGLRVVSWNVTNYNGEDIFAVQEVVYSETPDGGCLCPHIILTQEFRSLAAVDNFLFALNNAIGSPGDWAAAPFLKAGNTNFDGAMFYRTTAVDLEEAVVVFQGGNTPIHPRQIQRYTVRIDGFTSDAAELVLYNHHFKAGTSGTDQSRRDLQAERTRFDAENLPAGTNFISAGDFNIQRSTEDAYEAMVESRANNEGRLFDPISRPGTWNNSSTFRVIHTQDPAGPGGMDDRFDQILLNDDLLDGLFLDYEGDYPTPFNLSDWNDPNHSYRAFGNDGTSFNDSLTTAGNVAVGFFIAQDIIELANGANDSEGGHVPVYLDLIVPASSQVTGDLGFGEIPGAVAPLTLTLEHTGDLALFAANPDPYTPSNGIRPLDATLEIVGGGGAFAVSQTSLTVQPGGVASVDISVDTSLLAEGAETSATLRITSNDPDNLVRELPVSATLVSGACSPADIDASGDLSFGDVIAFIDAFNAGTVAADVTGDGEVSFGDVVAFIDAFNAGCP